jgi:hypothetical protein
MALEPIDFTLYDGWRLHDWELKITFPKGYDLKRTRERIHGLLGLSSHDDEFMDEIGLFPWFRIHESSLQAMAQPDGDYLDVGRDFGVLILLSRELRDSSLTVSSLGKTIFSLSNGTVLPEASTLLAFCTQAKTDLKRIKEQQRAFVSADITVRSGTPLPAAFCTKVKTLANWDPTHPHAAESWPPEMARIAVTAAGSEAKIFARLPHLGAQEATVQCTQFLAAHWPELGPKEVKAQIVLATPDDDEAERFIATTAADLKQFSPILRRLIAAQVVPAMGD